MQLVSERWNETIRMGHEKKTVCDLYLGGDIMETDIPVNDGVIEDDSTADVRRRCNLTLPGSREVLRLLPRDPAPEKLGLWPLGVELRLRSGIVYEDGTEELIPQGVFRVSRPEITQGPSGLQVTVAGFDRSRAFSRARFTRPWVINSSTDVDMVSAIKRLAMSRIPTLTEEDIILSEGLLGFGGVPTVTFLKDDDPWKMAQKMAQAIAAELVWTPNGSLWIRVVPNFNEQPPVFAYEEGEEATMTDTARSLDDERAYNGVTVTVENTSRTDGTGAPQDLPPLQISAWDTDPDSPTYYDPAYPNLSQYGPAPYFYSSEFITDEIQAKDAAEAMLQQVSGVIETITFTSIANPAHESGDIISIVNRTQMINSVNALDSFSMGVGLTSTMSGTCRRRRVTVGAPPNLYSESAPGYKAVL